MKKHFLTLCFLFISFIVFAGKFVLIPVTENNNLETLFNHNDLKIHYYCDDYVLATTDNLNLKGLVVLDENAFGDVDSYSIVFCMNVHKEEYLKKVAQSAMTLYSGENFFIMKILSDNFSPAKNDGMIGITNAEAKMSTSRYDYPVITEQNPLISNLISQVTTNSVISYIQTLEDFGTRNAQHPKHIEARDWIKQKYESFGLDVSLHSFNWNYYGSHNNHNVIAIQHGVEFPNEYIVLGGHYDSYTYESQGNAPGADDDASGVAGVMETAKILSQYDSKRSIIYCAFSAEEYGLFGSGAYAQKCFNEGMNILGYFNLDMTGYLKPGDPIHMSLIYPNSALTLANYFVNICDIYFPTIPVTKHTNLPWGDSDHTSFNNKGYKGIWWFEDINCDSPYIHHVPGNNGCGTNCTGTIPCLGDIIGPSVNNPEQVKVFTQAMVASIATLAEVMGTLPPPLNPPTNCLAKYYEGMSIKVTWDAPDAPKPDTYYVYRDSVQIAQTTKLFYMDTVADYGEYCYNVTAVWGEKESEYSNQSCEEIVPVTHDFNPPRNCKAEYFAEMSIKVTWDAPEPSEYTPNEYYIYRDTVKIGSAEELYYMDTVTDYNIHCYKVSAIYDVNESEYSNASCDKVPVGINEFVSEFKIYPNPTTGVLNLIQDRIEVTGQARNDVQSVEVFDVYGRNVGGKFPSNVLEGWQPQADGVVIDLTVFPAGIYFLKINTDKGITTKKIIKY